MLLAIDSGNTNIVFAVFDDEGAIRGEWRSSSHADRTADEFGVWLEQLMKSANLSPADITASIIATVVPATLFSLKSLCREYFDCDPLIVGEDGVDLELKILIYRPDDVGADRLDQSPLHDDRATLDRLPRNGHDASVLDGVVIRRLREQCSGVEHGKREEQHRAATCDPPRRHASTPDPEDKGGVH